MPDFQSADELKAAVGTHLGFSDWLEIDQAAHRPVRRRDRRPPVDPRRPRAGEGRSRSARRSRTATSRCRSPTCSCPQLLHGPDGEARRSTTARTRCASRRRCRSARASGSAARSSRSTTCRRRAGDRRASPSRSKAARSPRASSRASAAGCSDPPAVGAFDPARSRPIHARTSAHGAARRRLRPCQAALSDGSRSGTCHGERAGLHHLLGERQNPDVGTACPASVRVTRSAVSWRRRAGRRGTPAGRVSGSDVQRRGRAHARVDRQHRQLAHARHGAAQQAAQRRPLGDDRAEQRRVGRHVDRSELADAPR